MKIDALLDSNVLIALLVETHEHHPASSRLQLGDPASRFAIAAHSYAEVYCTLTRRAERSPFRFTPEEALAALESVRGVTELLDLTASQSFDAIRRYAREGGVGPRLYDRLIGEVAVAHGVATIVTWNVGHMRGLFPQMQIATPEAFATAGR